MRCAFALILILCSSFVAFSQQQKTFFQASDTLSLDSNVVDCASIQIQDAQGLPISATQFRCIPGSKIVLTENIAFPITVAFQSIQMPSSKQVALRPRSLIQPKSMYVRNPFAFDPNVMPVSNSGAFSSTQLNTSGSISRGIVSGNTKDLSVNSSLNLQLSGKLSEEIEVQAVVSDQNIPIQPEGNTAQLQDFDRVFITVTHPQWKVTAGDMQMISTANPFLIYNKRIKGLSIEHPFHQNKGKNQVSYSLARGKYARNTFQGREGNQGPYKLQGNSGETFIVVLSNSKRVYVDGNLLQRGENYDYVIDYNVGELTFTSRRIITANSRIYVEFEYSDRNYSRSLQLLNTQYQVSKDTRIEVQYYNEQDNPNRPLLQTLDRNQQLFLQSVGNDIESAFYPSVTPSSFQSDQIFYQKIDTLGFTEVLKYSPSDTNQIFKATFSFVGAGKGDYIIDNSYNLNTKVYKWIAPINGVSQGDYAPFVLLITPKKFQTAVLGIQHTMGSSTLGVYLANNNKDVNLYDTQVENKQAVQAYLQNQATWSSWKFNSGLSYQFTQKAFSPINRFRPQEFEREYGINQPDSLNLHSISAQLRTSRQGFSFALQPEVLLADSIQILNQKAKLNQFSDKNELKGDALYNTHLNQNRQFTQRYTLQNTHYLGKVLGFRAASMYEWLKDSSNLLRNVEQKEWKFSVLNPKESAIEYELGYGHFDNRRLNIDSNYYSTYADEYFVKALHSWSDQFLTNITATQREVHYAQFDSSTSFFIAQINQTYGFFSEGLKGNVFFESGIGSEPKRNISFVEVDLGRGTYTWVDFNNNGIKELNEFVIANFIDQANYVKIVTPSNEFVPSELQKINFSNSFRPSEWLSSTSFFGRFENDFNWTLNIKQFNKPGIINPIRIENDTALIALQQSLINTAYFNRYNERLNLDYTFNQSQNNSLLTNGIDKRAIEMHIYHLRLLFFESTWVDENYIEHGLDKLNSAFGQSNGYAIELFRYRNELIYNQSSVLRVSLKGAYTKKQNIDPESPSVLKAYELGLDSRFARLNKLTANAGMSFIQNDFSGNTNSNAAYSMLDGLQKGRNLVWNLNLQQNLPNKIQLTVAYQGRTAVNSKAIHTASIQARAFF
jgi:hypothetical protein